MDAGHLYQVSQWLIQATFFLLMIAAGETGYRLGGRFKNEQTDEASGLAVEGSLVGVVGLLPGVTLSMAVSRYETRKQLVLEEANATGTAYLRNDLLLELERGRIASILRRYVDLRLEYARAESRVPRLLELRQESSQLETDFSTQPAAYGREDPNPVRAGLLLQSLNEVIDLEAAGWMAFFNRIPAPLIDLDVAVAWLAALLVGYGFGFEGVRHLFSRTLLAPAVSVVLTVIVDLDRPTEELVQVSQQPVIGLQHGVNAQRP